MQVTELQVQRSLEALTTEAADDAGLGAVDALVEPVEAHASEVPEGLVEREICVLSGMPANPWCPSKQREHVPQGGDDAPCSWHHQADDGLLTVWPAEYREWARRSGLLTDPVTQAAAIGEASSRNTA